MSTLKDGMISLYKETMNYKLHKNTYEENIKALKDKHIELLKAIGEACAASEEQLGQVAAYIPEYVSEELGKVQPKRKRERLALDHNMNMVAFYMPLIGEAPTVRAQEITGQMVRIWNEKLPYSKISHSTFDSIRGGFKKGMFCYITTAVCRSLDKPDDCYELNLLRGYRDDYLLGNKAGEQIVKEYYNIAPTIVKRIGREENAEAVYRGIWEEYVRPCIYMIEAHKNEECKRIYSEMVRKLEKRYLKEFYRGAPSGTAAGQGHAGQEEK